VRPIAGAVLLTVGLAVLPAVAAAENFYGLSVSQGSTFSGFSVAETSGFAEATPVHETRVTITRAGVRVAETPSGQGQFPFMTQVPQPGDVLTLESPLGTTVSSVTYDGLPTVDATVCAGSANFSGQRSPGTTTMTGRYSSEGYGGPEGFVSVPLSSASAFAAGFSSALRSGETVYAEEERASTLAGGASFNYYSSTARPVGACPAPAAVPAVAVPVVVLAPALPVLSGRVLKLSHTTIAKLLKSGWLVQVSIDQPGTVTQDLYMVSGKLPAFASRKHSQPPAVLVARGASTVKKAGTVKVLVRATAHGRRALKHAKSVKLVLITTLRSSSGHRIDLGRHSLTLKS